MIGWPSLLQRTKPPMRRNRPWRRVQPRSVVHGQSETGSFVILHHSHRNSFATTPASNHCLTAQKSTTLGHNKTQNMMLSFVERIRNFESLGDGKSGRMQHDTVVKRVNGVVRRIMQSRQLINDSELEGCPGVFRIHDVSTTAVPGNNYDH